MKAVLGGWQVSGITTIYSGQPVSRISVSTNGFRRGGRADLVGDPGGGRADGVPLLVQPGRVRAAGRRHLRQLGRAPFRQPGRNQTDLASKNWTLDGTRRLQFRADLINAFNHTQWLADPNVAGLDNTCTTSLTTCNPATTPSARC